MAKISLDATEHRAVNSTCKPYSDVLSVLHNNQLLPFVNSINHSVILAEPRAGIFPFQILHTSQI